jgi:hypothetical protein
MAPKQVKSSPQRTQCIAGTLRAQDIAMRSVLPHMSKAAHQNLLPPWLVGLSLINKSPHIPHVVSFLLTAAGHTPTLVTLYAFTKQAHPLNRSNPDHPFDQRSLRRNGLPLSSSPSSIQGLLVPFLLAFYVPILLYLQPRIRDKSYVQLLLMVPMGLLLYFILPHGEYSYQEGLLATFVMFTPFLMALIQEDDELETGSTYLKSQWRLMKDFLAQRSSLELWVVAIGMVFMVVGGLCFFL